MVAATLSIAPAPVAIADRLRAAILSGSHAAGTRINQDRVAAEHGVSHIPVREALRRLEAEGLVTFAPRRGFFVARLSADDAAELGVPPISLPQRQRSRRQIAPPIWRPGRNGTGASTAASMRPAPGRACWRPWRLCGAGPIATSAWCGRRRTGRTAPSASIAPSSALAAGAMQTRRPS